MSFDPISAALELGTSVINRIWPDPAKQAEEQRKLQELAQNGRLEELNSHVKLLVGQMKINEESAKHKSVFVAGARPFIIWVGGFSMAWSGVVHPLLVWLVTVFYPEVTPPPLIESGALTAIVTGLLGVGGMRSFDKSKGVETNSIKRP
ncbi:hypothetical protein [Vibrio phage XM1]|nr:hypothetical protein [Vibrio phage XM1]